MCVCVQACCDVSLFFFLIWFGVMEVEGGSPGIPPVAFISLSGKTSAHSMDFHNGPSLTMQNRKGFLGIAFTLCTDVHIELF